MMQRVSCHTYGRLDEAAVGLPAGSTIHQHEASAGEDPGGAGGPSVRPETMGT